MLRAFVLTFHHDATRQVGNANRGIRLVHVLATGTGCAEGINFQIIGIDIDFLDHIHFGHHRHGTGRSVDTTLGLGFRYTLYAMATGLELETGICTRAFDTHNDFLVTTMLPGTLTDGFQFPAMLFGITGIHAEQVTGKQRSFITPGPGANFQKDILFVVGIPGQHQDLYLLLEIISLCGGIFQFLLGHFPHFLVVFLQHLPGGFDVGKGSLVATKTTDHRVYLGIFLRQGTKTILIADDLRIG